MKNLAAAVVAVLVLGGVLWLILGGGTAPPVPAGPPAPREKPDSVPPKPSSQAPARPRPTKEKETAARETAPPRRKKLAVPPSKVPGPKTGWKVLVVKKKTGKPVPGAQVLVLDTSTVKDPARLMREAATGGFSKIETFMEQFGRSFLADSKGVAWIPPIENVRMGALVAARKEGLWGLLPFRPSLTPPLKIEVSPVQEILVQVVDQEGKPVAGVPVGLGVSQGGFRYFPMRGVTEGPKGIVRFRHIGILFRGQGGSAKGLVALLVPMKKPASKEFDPKDLPRTLLVLTLPPTGKVVVYVRGPKGPVPDGTALAALSPAPEEGKEKPRFPIPPGAQEAPIAPVEGGKAVFPFVGLGLTLQVMVNKTPKNMPMMRGKPQIVKGTGPVAPGQTVTFHVSLTQKETLLAGRLLLPSGKPASETTLTVSLKTKEENISSFSSSMLRTDKDGRFRFPLEEGKFHGGKRTLSFLLGKEKGGRILKAQVDLGRDFFPGVNDLGDIRLGAPPVLVAGRVVDASGKPIQGATIQVFQKQYFGENKERSAWEWVRAYPTPSDAKGNFLVLGEAKAPELKVTASKQGWFQEKDVLASPGTEGLLLVLRKGGAVKATFLTDPGVPLKDLGMKLISHGREEERTIRFPQKKKTSAVWTGLPPGTYDLKVSFPYTGQPLVEIEGILVEGGKEAGDPRLKGIDLRGKIRVLNLEIVDEKGRGITNVWLKWGKDFHQGTWYRKGSPLLLGSEEGRTLWITASGYKPKKIQTGEGDVKVVLERGYKIRLVYTGEAPLPEAPFSLGVELLLLKRKGPGFLSFDFTGSSSAYFGKNGTGETWVSVPGKYRVTWLLKETGDRGWSSWWIDEKQRTVIEVLDLPGVQTFNLSLPAENLKKAVEKRQKDR